MRKLKEMDKVDFDEIITIQENISIEIPKECDITITEDKMEIAPSSHNEAEVIKLVNQLKLDNNKNKHIYLMTRVYNNNGTILYSKLANENFKADIIFQKV